MLIANSIWIVNRSGNIIGCFLTPAWKYATVMTYMILKTSLKTWYTKRYPLIKLKRKKESWLIEFNTYHRQHLHETKQIYEHHTRRGYTELHLEKGHRTLAIAPDGQQDEEGRAALQQAAGTADDHKDWTLRGMRVRRLWEQSKQETT